MKMRFISHSGAGAGEPNAHEVEWAGWRVLLDCGIGSGGAAYLEGMERPQVVWISHAHGDHCGALLQVFERWPGVKVMATEETRRLLRFALGGAPAARVEAVVRRVLPVKVGRYRDIPGMSGARIMALGAGHIPGAAMALFEFEGAEGVRRVLYTGDFCAHDQVVTRGAGVPVVSDDFRIDWVISEAVLATDREADELDYEGEVGRLIEALQGRRGPVLAGVFSMGESIEVAALMVRAGKRVIVDDYLRGIFEVSRGELGELWGELEFGDRGELARHLTTGGAVVAPGDQLQRGSAAQILAGPLLEDREATILVVNRARKKTGAGRIIGAKRGDELRWGGRRLRLEAEVIYGRMINHGPRWQLMGFLGALEGSRTFLVHASKGARWALKRALERQGFQGEIEILESGEVFEGG